MGILPMIIEILFALGTGIYMYLPLYTDCWHHPGPTGEILVSETTLNAMERLSGMPVLIYAQFALSAALIVSAVLRKKGVCSAAVNRTVFVLAAAVFVTVLTAASRQRAKY